MKEFIMSIPQWFWMIIISALVLPLSYSIFKNGVRARIETKLGSAEIDADDEKNTDVSTDEDIKK